MTLTRDAHTRHAHDAHPPGLLFAHEAAIAHALRASHSGGSPWVEQTRHVIYFHLLVCLNVPPSHVAASGFSIDLTVLSLSLSVIVGFSLVVWYGGVVVIFWKSVCRVVGFGLSFFWKCFVLRFVLCFLGDLSSRALSLSVILVSLLGSLS